MHARYDESRMGEFYLSLALVLIVIGVILLIAEVMVPTGGFLIVAALLFFGVAVGTIIAYGDTMEAALAVGGLTVGLPIIGFSMVSAWRRLAIGQTLDDVDQATAVSLPQIAELSHLRGRTGKTVSPMRPSGTVLIDGRRIDAMTEGMMLDAGVWVKCVDVRGGKVVVRQFDTPPDMSEIAPGEDLRPEPPPVELPPRPTAPTPPPDREKDDLDFGFDLPPK